MQSPTTIKNYTNITELITNDNESVVKLVKSEEVSNAIINKPIIRKKRPYRQFLRLIKRRKAITAIVMADILGVNRQTVSEWLQTPQAQMILNEQVDYHIDKISEAKDWKAHAHLIDLAKGKQETTNIQINNLDGLTIVRSNK